MFSHILTVLLSVLLLQASPSVLWKAVVNHSEGKNYQLVVTGQIAMSTLWQTLMWVRSSRWKPRME